MLRPHPRLGFLLAIVLLVLVPSLLSWSKSKPTGKKAPGFLPTMSRSTAPRKTPQPDPNAEQGSETEFGRHMIVLLPQ